MRMLLLLLLVASAVQAQQIDTVFPAPAKRVVDVSASSGSVQIKTWTRPEIRVEARGTGVSRVRLDLTASMLVLRQVASSDQPTRATRTDTLYDAQGRVIGLRYSLSSAGWFWYDSSVAARYGIDTSRVARDTTGDLPSQFRGRIGGRVGDALSPSPPTSVDYVITVPRYAGVIVRGGAGDIIVDGAIDSLDLSNVKGSIRATNVSGKVSLTSLEGRVHVDGVRGDLLARTLSGVVVIRDAEGSVEAQAIAGSIELHDVRAMSVTASTYEGGISLKGAIDPRANIALTTRSGPIALPAVSPCENAPVGTTQVTRNGQATNRAFMVVVTKRDSTRVTSFAGPLTCTLRRD